MAKPIIVADDGDDNEPDVFDQDGSDPDDDDDDSGDPPARPTGPRPSQPDVQALLAENERLKNATRRNNSELAKRRKVQQWMESHGIEDLDAWLAERGIDRETGQPVATPPPTAPPPTSANQPADAGELDRRLTLELEKRQAQWDEQTAEHEERAGKLETHLKRSAIVAALAKAHFNGTDDKALRVVDLDSVKVEPGEDGEYTIVGADEAVASLRTEIPEWFRPPRSGRPRTGGEDVDGARKPPRPPARPTWEQQVLGRITGARP